MAKLRVHKPTQPWLHPYTGPTRADIDATTLDGKVLCGYQGWFNTPGDGTNFGFGHWGEGLDRPGRRAIHGRHVARHFRIRSA